MPRHRGVKQMLSFGALLGGLLAGARVFGRPMEGILGNNAGLQMA